MRFHIISLFPEAMDSYLNESILARAKKDKLISIFFYNPRSFVKPTKSQAKNDKPYLRVDDKPYGGGPGMVIEALPVIRAIDKALTFAKKQKDYNNSQILFLSPSGKQFGNDTARKIVNSKLSDVVILCGRYEGIDARVKKVFKMKDISVGPFVTTGGELPALILIDVITRQIPGVLGNQDSIEDERNASRDVYTRPAVFEYKGKEYKVPKILLQGNHKLIEEWRSKRRGGTGNLSTGQN